MAATEGLPEPQEGVVHRAGGRLGDQPPAVPPRPGRRGGLKVIIAGPRIAGDAPDALLESGQTTQLIRRRGSDLAHDVRRVRAPSQDFLDGGCAMFM
jgi:hypothetical protein